ncbi:WASH complex subunit 2 isoform X1 [Frankliniella occidentalis]|uniref:WASH complex subunit 2 isoform X1 n=1 Tax=Frankliniella occidentalis TaxID=133901 RepID=A0A6J1S724_FRAOC|nr:WASH complex subunit 2 isoform X1 [Frankliniella occidentalis]
MNQNGDTSGSSKGKSWERPWSTDEMRQNAHAWNLAGDAGLLKHLQEFSQAVLARTHTTEKSLDLLNEEINTLTSELNNTNNKFLCLANTQFVENRVYDDDDKETPQTEAAPEKKSKEETEAKMLQKVREALSMSVAVLDTMFEPVEIQASDSEGECDSDKQGTKTLILEPHNPYIHRPLPHLIGSEPFMSDDQIGLGDTPSDDEDQSPKTGVDQDMETSSESDVDFPPFASSKRDRDIYSSHSSISDHPDYQERSEKQPKKIKPTDPVKNIDEDYNEVQEPTSSIRQSAQTNSAFAAQLAAKLDKIASPLKSTDHDTRNISVPSKSTSDNLFGEDHSDDEDDGLFPGNSSLFSDRPKLFDDLTETSDSLWGPEDPKPIKTSGPENNKTNQDIHSRTQNRVTTDLFPSTDDEDDLFPIKATNPSKSSTVVSKENIKDPGSIRSMITKQHNLKVGEIRPGLATSTPERGHNEENLENKSGLFGSVSQNLTQESSRVDTATAKNSSMIENEPSSRIDHHSQEKKPAGGVPMFGQADVLAGLKAKFPRRPSSSSSESSNSSPSERNSDSLQKSESTGPSVDHPTGNTVSADQGWSSAVGASQYSQSASLGFASPALTSTRLSNDDGYQTRNVLNSVSSIPAANAHYNDGDNISSRKSSAFDSQNPPSLSGGLFAEVNDDDDDDDDLFGRPTTKKAEKEQSQGALPQTAGNDSFKEDKKAPVSVTNEAPKTAQLSTNYSAVANTERNFFQSDFHSTVPPPLKAESKIKKPVSLFDDSDSGEDEILFSSASSAGSRRSQASTDILASAAVSSSEKKPLSKKGLFDDDDTLFGSARNVPDVDLFSEPSKPVVETHTSTDTKKTIPNKSFVEKDGPVSSDTTQDFTPRSLEKPKSSEPLKEPIHSDIFEDDLFAEVEDNDFLFGVKPKAAPKTDKVLLNSSNTEDEENDLFQNVSVPQLKQKESTQANTVQSKTSNSTVPLSKPSLVVENSSEPQVHSTNATLSEGSNKVSTSVKNYSIIEEPSNAAQPFKKPEPPRTLDIRKETDPGLGLLNDSDDDDDLFGTSVSKISAPAPKPFQKPQIASKPEPIVPKFDVKKPTDDGAPSSDSVGKPPGRSEVDGAAVSVSKLKDSLLTGSSGQPALKIDPRAFLPGQKPPLRKTPPKEDTDGLTVKEPLKASGSENPVSFEQPVTNNATLPSTNKDRAKLGVKRRPPSSKARRESARASMNLDQSDKESPLSPDVSSVVTDSNSAVNNTSVNSSNSVLSPSTDEDDLFGVPQDLPPEYGNQTLPSSDIFSGAPILSPLSGIEPAQQSQQNESKANSLKVSEEAKAILFTPPDLENISKTDDLFVSTQTRPDEVSMPNSLPVTGTCASKDTPTVVHPVGSDSSQTSSAADQILQDIIEELSHTTLSSSETSVKTNENEYLKEDVSTKISSGNEISGKTSAVDPLNKADHPSVSNDDDLFKPNNDFDDHSSLFPFVKKKPESKQSSNQPLFSQTPALPSKEDISVAKPGLAGLVDIDDDDLFSSSSKKAVGKKILDTSSKLKGKEIKTWKLSDDDDDDNLFQTGTKSTLANSSSISSSKVPIPVSSSAASQSVDSKLVTSKSSKLEVSVKKSKPKPSPGNGLFSDENDEDDDLFSKPSPFLKNKAKPTNVSKSSTLFDDDDDDLFGSKPSASNKPLEKKENNLKDAAEVKSHISTSSAHSKQNVFDDPLMSLGNKK